MFYRKISEHLKEWYAAQKVKKSALVIEGLRQVGKTTTIKEFLYSHYSNVAIINFKDSPSFKDVFKAADLDRGIPSLLATLSAMIPETDLSAEDCVLFLDEIQECSRARYAMKPLLAKTSLHIVASGSLLGIRGYNREVDGDIPTGSESLIRMHPMDFEEFLLAMGEKPTTLALLRSHFEQRTAIPTPIHEKMLALFHQYLVVGGMPEVVEIFVNTRSFPAVREKQRSLISEYRGDFGRFVDKNGEVRIDYVLRDKLDRILDCMPAQLAKENNKFVFKDIPGSPRKDAFEGALSWLCEFGLAMKCHRLDQLMLPLNGWMNPDAFKVYFQDSGLFVSFLDEQAPIHILKGDFGTYKGAIYENIVADAFIKRGKDLFYYANNNGLEIDFIIEQEDKVALVEVKARGGHTKASDTILNDKKKYDVDRCIKLTAGNIGEFGNKRTYPYYLAHLL